jgi:RNA polymerase sigma factor (sigma-70 family)
VDENRTTVAVQGYLNALAAAPDELPSEVIVRSLLARSVNRLQMLCGSMLYRSYPRLTRPPLNLQADELLSAVVERLIRALREVHPPTVRHFFALANQHMRWELNDLARRLDKEGPHLELHESLAHAGPASDSSAGNTNQTLRMLAAIDALPDEEREVLGLVRVQGMTHAEAANLLGVSQKTVQRRLNRCLVLLDDSCGDIIHPGAASPPALPEC